MSLTLPNIFKKRKKLEPVEKKEVKKQKVSPKTRKKISELAYRVLIAPRITEKTTKLAEKNQYSFKVFSSANKSEIKKAIKQIYDVDVLDVKIINVPKKPRRFGRTPGFRKGYKKAIVKIRPGQKIDIFPK